jgi:hypothetical protein
MLSRTYVLRPCIFDGLQDCISQDVVVVLTDALYVRQIAIAGLSSVNFGLRPRASVMNQDRCTYYYLCRCRFLADDDDDRRTCKYAVCFVSYQILPHRVASSTFSYHDLYNGNVCCFFFRPSGSHLHTHRKTSWHRKAG